LTLTLTLTVFRRPAIRGWRRSGRPFVGIFGSLVPGQWTEHDRDTASHQSGFVVRMSPGRDLAGKLCNLLEAYFGMSHLAAPEAERDFDLHFFAEEIDGMTELHAHVVRINFCAELDFLNLVGVLMFLRVFFAFGLFVAILPEIDEAANGGRGVGRDFHQVDPVRPREGQGILQGHHSDLLCVDADDAHFPGTNATIDPGTGVLVEGGSGDEGTTQETPTG
jgi:hypothetical protein